MTAPTALSAALPQYRIGAEIGSGGMGVVYAGVHRSLGRQVAIKQLPAEVAGKPGLNDRFDHEARVLASLDHPHIVPVYDYVHAGHGSLLVMEKLNGGTVYHRFAAGRVTGEQACAILLATLAGLHAAHTAGVLHLDVKPKNLLFSAGGVVKVADFGIAQVISEGATLVTHGGEVQGTPAYIAPEQAMGNALSPAADVYSAGTVLYELLSGEVPFDSTRGALSMMRQHMFTDPRPIRGVPEPLAGVVMRSIARELPGRYREAETFAADLASAATAVYGPGWLERSGVPVLHLTPRVVSALATPHVVPKSPTLTTARPATSAPRWPILGAVAALLVLAALAIFSPTRLPHVPQASTVVAGAPLPGPATVNLSRPISIEVDDAGDGPVDVTLGLSVANVPLGSASAPAQTTEDGRLVTEVEQPGLSRWIVGGAVTGELTLSRPGDPVTVQRFTLVTEQHPLASALGAGSLLLALFAAAYLESGLRTLRQGRRWRAAKVAGPVLGAVFGVTAWLFASVLLGHEPSPLFALGAAAAGGVAAACVVLGVRPRSASTR
ncbi:serine/threonine protein kinase [Saccharothrix sp. AJ9571]|nr:serine/threonine protein kinase [Saccharothrix sp. AJ9571]